MEKSYSVPSSAHCWLLWCFVGGSWRTCYQAGQQWSIVALKGSEFEKAFDYANSKSFIFIFRTEELNMRKLRKDLN